ncbi:MAG: hypothetical protein L0227_14875 [Chloroflexi bacterium]|nr:hypothetical protein [Chloroflexota bacterium]
MIKAAFLVPIRDNDGRPFPRSSWIELERRLVDAFGGYSRMSAVHGAWEEHGRVYRDVSRQYVASLSSWMELPVWLDLVRWVRQAFRQEAIYIEVAGVPEIVGKSWG